MKSPEFWAGIATANILMSFRTESAGWWTTNVLLASVAVACVVHDLV